MLDCCYSILGNFSIDNKHYAYDGVNDEFEKETDEMKLLIMCEGPNEKEIIDILLEHGKLIFTADDLLVWIGSVSRKTN